MSTPSPNLNKKVYCTACSVQTGKNKNSVYHDDITITADNVKPTYKNPKNKKEGEPGEKKIIGYVAILECPVTKRKISTFIDKSKAQELLNLLPPTDGDSSSKN